MRHFIKSYVIIMTVAVLLSNNAYAITPSSGKSPEIIKSVIHTEKFKIKSAAAENSDTNTSMEKDMKKEKTTYCGSKKLSYLKKGYSAKTEENIRKNQNYWGKGVSSSVKLPVHLAEWERFRRKKNR